MELGRRSVRLIADLFPYRLYCDRYLDEVNTYAKMQRIPFLRTLLKQARLNFGVRQLQLVDESFTCAMAQQEMESQ